MNKFILLAVTCSLFQIAKAAPGDTTWVQANNTQLTYYGNFDTSINFPTASVTYRRIYMIFTLGKYVCPGYTPGTGAVPWCGDWDYTVTNYLMTPGGDTLELSRLITPYANNAAPRTPYTWTHRYIFDVTDYASKLNGAATTRILYSGYSGGFTANVKFAFIEGTPDRTVVGIKKLWNGSYAYGDTTMGGSRAINTRFTAVTETAPVGTQTAALKFTVTGHGADANYCSEFCSKNYNVLVNGGVVSTQTIWRDNCGANEFYPQSGTWVYNRGNWCPGATVTPHYNWLTGVTAGTTYTVGAEFESYVGTGAASYSTDGTLIYYGPLNKTVDATIEDIVTPTNNENYWRENPACGEPTIHIKNTGSTAITSMDFVYGVRGYASSSYTWSGSLASLQEMDIKLPGTTSMETISGSTGLYTFDAKISQVNGAADLDSSNNVISSSFATAPLWPLSFKINMTTNNESIATGSTTSETSWVIYDMANNIVAQRTGALISKAYSDTVTLGAGCYKLVIYDSSCNGLYWWANPTGITAGSLMVKQLNGTNIAMRGYSYSGTYRHDFGCGYTQYFYTNFPTSILDINENNAEITVYPNPASDVINIDFEGMPLVDGTISIIDVLGREMMYSVCNSQHAELNTSSLSNGIYTVRFKSNDGQQHILTSRIVIAK